jgi:hypothetical protein
MVSERSISRRIAAFDGHSGKDLPSVGLIGVMSAETFEPHPSGTAERFL